MKAKRLFGLILPFLFLTHLALAKIPKPEEVLGIKVGEDRKLADMKQIVEYFQKLDEASERIKVTEVGKTTMGNPFIVAIITSESNQASLEKYRNYQQRLADPRKTSDVEAEKIIREGKAVVMINCSIHASEIGASQMSMELAYDLATGEDKKTREILDNVILLLVPMHNPDGTQMVVDWYKKNLGTKYEGGMMPWLYHKYVGHDNNRDWYMLTQQESKLTISKIHNVWHPQVILDMHQMGSNEARIFVPPYVDPFEPNIDPILEQEVAMMGTFMATEMTAEGKAGVIHSSGYDAWTPGRAYHHYHGGIRILTEVASAKLATPVEIKFEELSKDVIKPSVKMPMPWKGGRWTLRDIVEYDYSAAMAVLTNSARLRENWLRNFYLIHKKAVSRKEPPFSFLVPQNQKDLSTAVKMLNALQMGEVEIHKAEEDFTADGGTYTQGTYIIYIAQPCGAYAKALLESQEYPEIREYPDAPLKTPYDVVAHTLPLLMGVEVIRVDSPFKVKATLLEKIAKPEGKIKFAENAFGFVWGNATNDETIALNRLIKKGYKIFWSAEKFEEEGKAYSPGAMIVEKRDGLDEDLKQIVKELYIQFEGLKSKPQVKTSELKPARLGVYKSWTAPIDEGWTRWVLEQNEFPYSSVYDKDIRAGELNQQFDVIIFPDMREEAIIKGLSDKQVPSEYSGGIGEVGVKNIKAFIEEGGAIITLNAASSFPINQFYLAVDNSVEKVDRKSFYIPGSILRVLIDSGHPIASGYRREGEIFFRGSPVFAPREGSSVVTYPLQNPLLSGWINGASYLQNRSALVDIPYGKGKIILIGFPVQFRGQAHGTFRFLFNSIYYAVAKYGDEYGDVP